MKSVSFPVMFACSGLIALAAFLAIPGEARAPLPAAQPSSAPMPVLAFPCGDPASDIPGMATPCPWPLWRTQACKDACKADRTAARNAAEEACEEGQDGCEEFYGDALSDCDFLFGPNGTFPDPAQLYECQQLAGEMRLDCLVMYSGAADAARDAADDAYHDCMMWCCIQ